MRKLPEGWVNAPIKELCHLINGKAFKPSEWSTTGLPIVRIQNLNNPSASYNYFDGHVEDRFLIENGDLLFAWSGTPGTSFGAHIWKGERAVLNQHIFKIVYPRNLIDQSFFKYAINQKLDEIIRKAHGGSGLRHITKGKFEKISISLPPISEQKLIVESVEGLLQKSGDAKAALDTIPSLIDQYRQTVLAAAFRGDLTKNSRSGISEGWSTGTVGSIVRGIQSGKSFKCVERPPKAGEKGIVKVSAVSWGHFNEDESKTVTDTSRLNEKAKILEGDFLFSRANTIELVGACLIAHKFQKDLYLSDKILRLDVPDEYKIYLKWFLRSPAGRMQIEEKATGAQHSMRNISQASLRNIEMPFPPKKEMLLIGDAMEEMERFADQIYSRIVDIRSELNAFDQSVLAKAFRGELAPQDANVEHASALLRRIKIERNQLEKKLKSEKKMAEGRRTAKNKKTIISITDALRESKKALSSQELFSAAGYPIDADTDLIEQFFLDIRKAIDEEKIQTWREQNQDIFKLVG